MKIVIAGGTGHVGSLLCAQFLLRGDEVVVLSRSTGGPVADGIRLVAWNAGDPGAWTRELENAEVLVNLVGRSVDCRYTQRHRREILDSRVRSTRALAAAVADAIDPPRVWLQAGTATIYAHRYDAPNGESDGILGGSEPDAPDTWRFSIEVAQAWEREADAATLPRTRLVKLRSAMTMSPERGGVFDVLSRLIRLGMGGAAGDGRQYVSWIHGEDFVRAVEWLIAHETISGAVNVSSPHPLPNREFMRLLRQAWGRRIGLPAPRMALALGAFLLRTETELILKSRRVVPERLVASGFEFRFPDWAEAAADLVGSSSRGPQGFERGQA